MSCNKLRKQIVLALDGRLDPGPDWQSHLSVCPACRTWLEEQRAVADLLATPVRLEPSSAFAATLQRRIRMVPPPSGRIRLPLIVWPALARQAALALIFSAAVLIGLLLGPGPLPPDADEGSASFQRTLNLELFADLPAESFGAVYAGLLQGERP